MYVTMRHLFNRGFYKPMGVSGESLRQALLSLRPEIYGTVAEDKIELNGLLYVFDRLPKGIEECRFINLTSDEGYGESHFKTIVPPKRRRNCYRIDEDQMNIEITRGRSEIYDILTHLTFVFIESSKIMQNVVVGESGQTTRDWKKLKEAAKQEELTEVECEVAITHAANILGHTFEEISSVFPLFATPDNPNRFLHLIHEMGAMAIREIVEDEKRLVTFSPVLRERLGHHIHGEKWADKIKLNLIELGLIDRPVHIISANLHSVMNAFYTPQALPKQWPGHDSEERFKVYEMLSQNENADKREAVRETALKNGMFSVKDESGANINVQIFDTQRIKHVNPAFQSAGDYAPVIVVMDYAFGEQAYETMDELLKPIIHNDEKIHLDVDSISIMGKAGTLEGKKGDILVPDAHLFEGTADNYPFENQLRKKDLETEGIDVQSGAMITVLGTSLQNKDILRFFHESTWKVVGLEMEGAHYQKAIQAASQLRGSIKKTVDLRYAYYASDNPLETGSTLASGGLGRTGVKPTYLITEKIIQQIFKSNGAG